jgi:glycerol uptake facilitator-like aquaporin
VKRIVAEFLGTAFLLAGVVGSGIMAAKLAGDNGALALLCNTLPTGAILTVLILTFGPVSGAHFNPAVSIALALRREVAWRVAGLYIAAQIVGGIVGVLAAHAMFELPLWQVSMRVRTGPGQWLAEGVATFGLLLTIFGCAARTPAAIPYAVGLYITSAYWFTASTSFANPAVTIARALSDTYGGSRRRVCRHSSPLNLPARSLLQRLRNGYLPEQSKNGSDRNPGRNLIRNRLPSHIAARTRPGDDSK